MNEPRTYIKIWFLVLYVIGNVFISRLTQGFRMVYGILREMVPVCFCCRADGNQNPFPRLEEFSVRREATMIDQIVTLMRQGCVFPMVRRFFDNRYF